MLVLTTLYRSIGAMIHQSLSPDRVHPQISPSLRLLVRCLVRQDLFVIYYSLVIYLFIYLFIFFKGPISFIGSLDGVFNALIMNYELEP